MCYRFIHKNTYSLNTLIQHLPHQKRLIVCNKPSGFCKYKPHIVWQILVDKPDICQSS